MRVVRMKPAKKIWNTFPQHFLCAYVTCYSLFLFLLGLEAQRNITPPLTLSNCINVRMQHHGVLRHGLFFESSLFSSLSITIAVTSLTAVHVILVLKEMTGDGEDVTINGGFPGTCQEKLTHISQELLLLKHSLHPTTTIYIFLARHRRLQSPSLFVATNCLDFHQTYYINHLWP